MNYANSNSYSPKDMGMTLEERVRRLEKMVAQMDTKTRIMDEGLGHIYEVNEDNLRRYEYEKYR